MPATGELESGDYSLLVYGTKARLAGDQTPWHLMEQRMLEEAVRHHFVTRDGDQVPGGEGRT